MRPVPILRSVDLPHPFRPKSAVIRPSYAHIDAAFRIVRVPKALLTESTEYRGVTRPQDVGMSC
jgi:hypothetical protein